MNLLMQEISNNHEISVYDTTELYGEKGKFRVMQFSNGDVQGALDMVHPERIVFEYPRAMIHLMEFNNPSFEDVFVIGHGIGSISGHYVDKRFKVAELDEKVLELSRLCFGYRKDNVIIGDGRHILERERQQAYDYIILDAFTENGTPRHLISKEFFRMSSTKLDYHGSILLNLLGKGENDNLVTAIYTTLSEEYGYTKAFYLPSEGVSSFQNIIIMGSSKSIGFQARHMAGFIEIELGRGHLILDREP